MANDTSRVKISDIASKAGVSSGTVDRVIHNRGEVSAKTRKKVMEIIREMDYQPDILASTLASRKTWHFASLMPRPDKNNPFWASPASGLKKAWEEIRHFGITLREHHFCYHSQDSFTKSFDELLKEPPSGLLLAPVFAEASLGYMEQLRKLDIPVVLINTHLDSTDNVAFVGQDAISSGRVAAKLLDYGLEADAEIFIINIISDKGGNNHILNRELGFRQYFRERGVDSMQRLITLNITNRDVNEMESILMEKWLEKADWQKGKGIFVSNSKVFLVANFLERAGITNAKLIGYDLLEQNQQYLQSGKIDFLISQQPDAQGYASVMTLFNHLVMKREVVKDQFLPIDIITKENIHFYINK